MNRFLASLFLLTVLACSSDDPAPTESFGADFTPTEVLAADALLTTYSERALIDTVRTTVRGTVHEVCQAKGCWMTVSVAGEDMMVKFKDYGFFVPKDIGSEEVILHGAAYYQLTDVEELRHFAKDAGKSDEEIAMITEPRRELHFLADGVQLY
ncbi:hypothetical protein GGR28_003353 [Lewinella aquimaris]|uniref:DUF4920 domain-containing protein n=1 Tax=Neolewinella aquimaris TaxID=1835722 RepID=A0A840EFL7_9BACT|nr:DUF4920 domain-containing protein [Neolewinella aquimaris]MBB4080718.1 hypothetical protein [Neolewinella aquimaris]